MSKKKQKAEMPKRKRTNDPTMSDSLREDSSRERCQAQARALWEMYYAGQLIMQTIAIGGMTKTMLLSHKSQYAV